MVASAEAAKRVDGDLSLLRRDADDIEATVAEQEFEIRSAGLALAAPITKESSTRVTAESNRTGASPRARANRSASDCPARIATSAEVSITIHASKGRGRGAVGQATES